MVSVNPYAVSRNENEFEEADYSVSQNAYAVPSGGAPYGLPGQPFATVLEYDRASTPDPTRVMRDSITDARQDPVKPKKWWQRRNVEQSVREQVQDQSGIWVEEQHSQPIPVPRALGIQTETRPLASTSPNTYSFTRPFTGMTPKRFNGIHFSMADHRRYGNEIFGMVPPRSPRGTYRADVAGYSEGEYDMVEAADEEYVYSVNDVPSSGRSFRLD